MRKLLAVRNSLLVLTIAVLCLPALAQTQGNIRSVLFVRVKPDQQDAWKAAVKDFVALKKKAGSTETFTIWQAQTGPDMYAVVWYSQKWKDIGEEDPKLQSSKSETDAIFKRLNASSYNTELWIDEMQPDLMIVSKTMPKFVRTGRTRVQPGKMDETKAVFRDQILPAYKKAGNPDFGVAVARYGTPTNEFHTYAAMTGWGDLDSPFGVQKGMSEDDWKAFQSKISSLIESTEFTIWEYQPDLSFPPNPTK